MAGSPLLPILRLQRLSRLPPLPFGILCGALVFTLVFSPVFLLQLNQAVILDVAASGLFFGSSIAIVAGATAPVLHGTARDLEQARGVISISDGDYQTLESGLFRQAGATTALLLLLGLGMGFAHNYLLGHHRNPMPFLFTQSLATVLMWVAMMLTLPKMVANALVFSRLGRVAQPDLLRPSRHAAFGTAALRPAVFVIGIICAYGFLLLGSGSPLDEWVWLGVASSFVTLLGIVVLPLRGIRQRIQETRGIVLAALDHRIEKLDVREIDQASLRSLDEMDTLLDMRERVARAPGWPLDLAGLKRILLYTVLPPLSWAAAALVEKVIDSAL